MPTTIPVMGLYKLAENFKQERKKIMSREVMFTRSITTTTATVMICNVAEAKVETAEITVPIDTDDCTVALKWLQKNNDPARPVVAVTAVKSVTKLYGCSIEKFLSVAQELDENRKPINS